MNTYQEYLEMPLSLTFEDMNKIHTQMVEEIGNDEIAKELYEDLLSQARKYHYYRSNWPVWSREEKIENDPNRTVCHDSLIIKFNMLARYLRQNGKTATWRDSLGDEKADPYVRKRIGDFACYLICIDAISSR